MVQKTSVDLLDVAVRENLRRTGVRLRAAEPTLADPINTGKLMVVGARYDLDDGKVDLFHRVVNLGSLALQLDSLRIVSLPGVAASPERLVLTFGFGVPSPVLQQID